MPDLFKPSYRQTLRELQQTLKVNPVLGPFWRQQRKWPRGHKNMVFIGDAFDRIGRAKHRAAWTKDDFKAFQRIYPFPDFADTLAMFRHDFDTYQHKQKRDSLPLVESDEELRRAYDRAAASWRRFETANAASLERLTSVIETIIECAAAGTLETHLRRVDTTAAPGPYQPAPDSFWDVENPIENRIRDGNLAYNLSYSGERHPDPEPVYIFFTAESVNRCLGNDKFEHPAGTEDLYFSPFMQEMIKAIRRFNITPENQPKKTELQAYFIATWPGEKPLSDRMAERMAGCIRDEDSQLGRARKDRK